LAESEGLFHEPLKGELQQNQIFQMLCIYIFYSLIRIQKKTFDSVSKIKNPAFWRDLISLAGSELKPSNQLLSDLSKTYEFCILNQTELDNVLSKCQL
jgi:hypothetical protein